MILQCCREFQSFTYKIPETFEAKNRKKFRIIWLINFELVWKENPETFSNTGKLYSEDFVLRKYSKHYRTHPFSGYVTLPYVPPTRYWWFWTIRIDLRFIPLSVKTAKMSQVKNCQKLRFHKNCSGIFRTVLRSK